MLQILFLRFLSLSPRAKAEIPYHYAHSMWPQPSCCSNTHEKVHICPGLSDGSGFSWKPISNCFTYIVGISTTWIWICRTLLKAGAPRHRHTPINFFLWIKVCGTIGVNFVRTRIIAYRSTFSIQVRLFHLQRCQWGTSLQLLWAFNQVLNYYA